MRFADHQRRLFAIGLLFILVAYALTAIGVTLLAYPIFDRWPEWLVSTIMAIGPIAAIFVLIAPPVTAITVVSRWWPDYTKRNVSLRLSLAGLGVFLTGLGSQLVLSAVSGQSSVGLFAQPLPNVLAMVVWSYGWGALGLFFDWLIVGRHFSKPTPVDRHSM